MISTILILTSIAGLITVAIVGPARIQAAGESLTETARFVLAVVRGPRR